MDTVYLSINFSILIFSRSTYCMAGKFDRNLI